MENWVSWQPFQKISLSPAVCRSHMNAASSAKRGGELLGSRNSQPARMRGDLKQFGSKHVYRCHRQEEREGRKPSVLPNDPFEMNTLLVHAFGPYEARSLNHSWFSATWRRHHLHTWAVGMSSLLGFSRQREELFLFGEQKYF